MVLNNKSTQPAAVRLNQEVSCWKMKQMMDERLAPFIHSRFSVHYTGLNRRSRLGWSASTWVEPRFKQLGVALKGGWGREQQQPRNPKFRTQVQPRKEPRFEPRFNPGSNLSLTRFEPRFQPGLQSGIQAFLKLLRPSLNSLYHPLFLFRLTTSNKGDVRFS